MTRNDVPTLVIGSGGLLGRHVVRALGSADVPTQTASIPWDRPDAARQALRRAFTDLLAVGDGSQIDIVWCAGAGVVATPAEDLDAEVALFRGALADLRDRVPPETSLGFFFASSAGGLYAGSTPAPFTETTEPRPLAPYGRAKLAMEQALTEFCDTTGAVALIGRISNLYGPGQNLAKPQGLVSQLCLSHLRGTPLPVYVSLDTIRDYLYVGDCAAMVVDALGRLRQQAHTLDTNVIVKIMASGAGVTLASVVNETNRIFHRRARLALASAGGAGQVRDLRLRSTAWPELKAPSTPFGVGVRRTADAISRAFNANPSALPNQVSELSIR